MAQDYNSSFPRLSVAGRQQRAAVALDPLHGSLPYRWNNRPANDLALQGPSQTAVTGGDSYMFLW